MRTSSTNLQSCSGRLIGPPMSIFVQKTGRLILQTWQNSTEKPNKNQWLENSNHDPTSVCVCVCVCCSYRFPIKNWCVFQPVMLVFFWGGGYGSSNAVTQLGWHVEIMWKSKSSKSDQLCAPFHLLAKLNHHTERTEFDLGYHSKFWCCLGNCY